MIATSGLYERDLQEQLVGVARLADDLEAAVLEQAGDALAEEDGVLGENDSRHARVSVSSTLGRVRQRAAAGSRREARDDELVDPLGPRKAAQAMLAEVAQLGHLARRAAAPVSAERGSARRGRPRRSAPRGARRRRSTSLPRAPACPCGCPCGRASLCGDAAVPRPPPPRPVRGSSNATNSSSARQSTSMPPDSATASRTTVRYALEHAEVVLAEPVDKARRVLDVAEEERDDAARQRVPGQPATSLCRPCLRRPTAARTG